MSIPRSPRQASTPNSPHHRWCFKIQNRNSTNALRLAIAARHCCEYIETRVLKPLDDMMKEAGQLLGAEHIFQLRRQ